MLCVLAQTICSAFANVKFSEPKFAEHDAKLLLAARRLNTMRICPWRHASV
jgi:hypothetical protein